MFLQEYKMSSILFTITLEIYTEWIDVIEIVLDNGDQFLTYYS